MELCHWLPGQKLPEVLASSPVFGSNLFGSTSENERQFNGLTMIGGLEYPIQYLLSTDAQSWLIPVKKEQRCCFKIFNALTGRLQSELDLPVNDIDHSDIRFLGAAFSSDGKSVLVQTKDQFTWFDVQTGQRIRSQAVSLRNRFDVLCQTTPRTLSALTYPLNLRRQNDLSLQILTEDETWHTLPLSETLPQPPTVVIDGARHVIGTEMNHIIHNASNTLVYVWRHVVPIDGFFLGPPPYLPGHYYAVRDLTTAPYCIRAGFPILAAHRYPPKSC
ncbi:MAG: hypothetical protein QM703_15860 [Gemmatales bacterium]